MPPNNASTNLVGGVSETLRAFGRTEQAYAINFSRKTDVKKRVRIGVGE